MRIGPKATAPRPAGTWRRPPEEYEEPTLDDGIRSELEAFVTRRRRGLGD